MTPVSTALWRPRRRRRHTDAVECVQLWAQTMCTMGNCDEMCERCQSVRQEQYVKASVVCVSRVSVGFIWNTKIGIMMSTFQLQATVECIVINLAHSICSLSRHREHALSRVLFVYSYLPCEHYCRICIITWLFLCCVFMRLMSCDEPKKKGVLRS